MTLSALRLQFALQGVLSRAPNQDQNKNTNIAAY